MAKTELAPKKWSEKEEEEYARRLKTDPINAYMRCPQVLAPFYYATLQVGKNALTAIKELDTKIPPTPARVAIREMLVACEKEIRAFLHMASNADCIRLWAESDPPTHERQEELRAENKRLKERLQIELKWREGWEPYILGLTESGYDVDEVFKDLGIEPIRD